MFGPLGLSDEVDVRAFRMLRSCRTARRVSLGHREPGRPSSGWIPRHGRRRVRAGMDGDPRRHSAPTESENLSGFPLRHVLRSRGRGRADGTQLAPLRAKGCQRGR